MHGGIQKFECVCSALYSACRTTHSGRWKIVVHPSYRTPTHTFSNRKDMCVYVQWLVMSHLNEPRKPKKNLHVQHRVSTIHILTKSTKTNRNERRRRSKCLCTTHWNNRRLCYGLWKSVCEFVDGIDVPSVQMQFGKRTVRPLVYLSRCLFKHKQNILWTVKTFCSTLNFFLFVTGYLILYYSIFPIIRNDPFRSVNSFGAVQKNKTI